MPRELPPTLNLVPNTLVQVGSGIIGGIKVHSYTLQCVCVWEGRVGMRRGWLLSYSPAHSCHSTVAYPVSMQITFPSKLNLLTFVL